MKVALDIDNVTSDTAPYLLNHINRKYGTNYTPEDVKEWDMMFDSPKGKIDYTKELFHHFGVPGFLYGVPVMEGAQAGVGELMRQGHKPFFLTGRQEKKHGPETEKWRKEYFPDVKVYYAPEGKRGYANKADVFLEDSPKEIRDLGLHGGNVLVYDRPWNRAVSPIYGSRVHSWEEFLNSIRHL